MQVKEVLIPVRRFAILLAAVVGVLVQSAGGATYYVRKTGNDGSSGTSPAQAWLTIDRAANTMVAGDVVYVGAGTYTEQVSPNNDGTSGSPIRFFADTTGAMTGDAGTVTVQASGAATALEIDSDNYIEFTGFTLRGGSGEDVVRWRNGSTGGRLVSCDIGNGTNDAVDTLSASLEIDSCTLHDVTEDGVDIDQSGTILISNCQIYNCQMGVRCWNTGPTVTITRTRISGCQNGVYNDNNRGLTIVNCLIYTMSGDGVYVANMAPVTLQLTTIANCQGDGFENGNDSSVVRNCIFSTITGLGIRKNNGAVSQSYNLFYQCTGGAHPNISNGTGELTSNPLFIGSGSYQLSGSSPALNAGTDASSVTTVDMLNVSRPQSGGWDMGCYELAAPLFTDVSSAKGFNVQTTSSDDQGSGLHWGDFDNDGDLDAIITGNQSRLALNQTVGTSFTMSTFGGGSVYRQGALADFDNDGDIDFFAACIGSYDTEGWFANSGAGIFTSQGNGGFSQPSNNENAAAADLNWDGWCDLAFFSGDNGNWFGFNGASSGVTFSGSNASMYRINDSGDYGNGDYCSSGDINNDWYVDFFYHYGSGKLFASEGDGTYREGGSGISITTGNSEKIGSAWGDYDNDGDLDLFVPRYASGNPGTLWRNSSGSFTNVAAVAGLTHNSGQRSCCWGDYDNDGYLDLYIVTRSGGNILYRNLGNGTFSAASEGAAATGDNHDAVFVDFDNDGDLDLAVTRRSATNVLLRNGKNNLNYLKVRALGYGNLATNKAAIGTRIELYASDGTTLLARRDVGVARGYGGSEPLWVHFGGVNPASTYVVKVYFQTGVQTASIVPQAISSTIGATIVNQMLTVQEPAPPPMKITGWQEVEPHGP